MNTGMNASDIKFIREMSELVDGGGLMKRSITENA